jgi:signal transduction histidine kinase
VPDTLSRSLRRTAGFALLYVLATYAGRLTVMDATNLSLVWPAAGILAVWFVLQRQSRWRALDAVALAAVTVAVNLFTGATAGMAAVFVVANLAQGYVFVALFNRWLPDLWLPNGQPMARLSQLWLFIAAAAASTTAGALIGPTGQWLITGHYSIESAFVWQSRNAASVVLVGVAVWRIGWSLRERRLHGGPSVWSRLGRPRQLEYLAVVTASAVGYYAVFGRGKGAPTAFVLIVMTIWAGLRMRTTFVILHDLTFGTVAILFTLHGNGPFAQIELHSFRALVAQLFVIMVTVVGLALALGRDERDGLLDKVRASEGAAVEQSRMMGAIIDAMTEGLSVIDEDGRFRLRNPAVARLTGIDNPTDQVQGSDDFGLFQPDGTPLDNDDMVFRQIFAGRYERPVDMLVRSPGVPEGRIIQVSGAELPTGADGRREAVVVFHDVTADRRHRDELASFAGVVAHDLLNPLTTIEGWSEALAAELSAEDEFAGSSVARIRRAAARMRSMINGLLAYTTARDASLSPTAVDLDEVVRDIATARLDQAASTAVPAPRFDIGDLGMVDADPVLARQLLENLISNAIKYTAPGVVPHIAVSGEVSGDGFLRVAVSDNGIGIPAGQHEAIFQNFHRAHVGAGYAGTGLGLAICKRIVERHGGTITATAGDNGGSLMTFTLPALRL